MKVVYRSRPEYVGWWLRCQHCHSIAEVEKEGDLKTHEAGDFKDEGTLKWQCPNCNSTSYGSYSRLKSDNQAFKRNREILDAASGR